ncbi:homoserine dehydrogenase [Brevibacillus sp. 179-C 1.1 NHS]|uniref:homoserine dehydrogenase n=1 Tax=Brevibacillus sp. 179-C 1.1 NHS TaxID=3235177 RepID=UPI0039A1AA5E
MKRWNIMLTGFGTVGQQVAKLLEQRRERYRNLYQADVRLVGVVRSASGLYDENGIDSRKWENYAQAIQAVDPSWDSLDFMKSVQADVLIEAGPSMKDGGPGLTFIRYALKNAIHAIAISKGALVVDYAGLAALAKKQGVELKISGATAAALPTIDLLRYNLAGCEVKRVEGIFTGTTNFVLTKMMDEGLTCTEAVQLAQKMGIAEPDPSYDIDGWDTASKLTILANAAFDAQWKLSDIVRTSIREVTSTQIETWKKHKKIPKLIGTIQKDAQGSLSVAVELRALDAMHPFAAVSGTTKAIRVETDVMGDLLVVGGKSDPVAAAAAALKDLEHIISK